MLGSEITVHDITLQNYSLLLVADPIVYRLLKELHKKEVLDSVRRKVDDIIEYLEAIVLNVQINSWYINQVCKPNQMDQ